MTGRAGEMTATVSTLTDPVSAVGSLVELIRADCADMDATRKVPTAVIAGLQDAGVFRLLAPVEIGGSEVDPVTFLNVVEAASHADGSVGWCVMIGGCYATFGGLLPSKVHARSTATLPPFRPVRSVPMASPSRSTAAFAPLAGGRWPAGRATPTGMSEAASS